MSSSIRLAAVALCIVAVFAVGGCSSPSAPTAPSQSPAALEGVRWVATDISREAGEFAAVVGGAQVTAEFAGGKMSGSGGVNSYSAAYKTSGANGIEIDSVASTLIAGPEPLMAQESAYFRCLENAEAYRVTGTSLELVDKAGEVVVRYTASKPVELRGTTWYCTGYNNGKEAVVSLVAGSQITAAFAQDGTLAGSAGVNTYQTTYTTRAPAAITIAGEIATTMMAGPDALMAQESAYLKALPKAGFYRVSGDTLELRESANGPLLATYSATVPQ
jgi:heat shock protein HslJ